MSLTEFEHALFAQLVSGDPQDADEIAPSHTTVDMLRAMLIDLKKAGVCESPHVIADDGRGNVYMAWARVFCFLDKHQAWSVLDPVNARPAFCTQDRLAALAHIQAYL